MPHIKRTLEAERDLEEIWRYIAERNPRAADGLLKDIEHSCEYLAHYPKTCTIRPELGNDLRLYPIGNYVIIFKAMADGILVVRVAHGSRHLPGLV